MTTDALACSATRVGRSRSEESMDKHRVFRMSFASVYPHYVQKAFASPTAMTGMLR